LDLAIRLVNSLELLLLNHLLEMARGQSFEVVDYYVFGVGWAFVFDHPFDELQLGEVGLVGEDTVAHIVRSLFKHELRARRRRHTVPDP